ncbi:MAG: glycosyltransferase family 1 protein [Thermodesulfobacteriota bacterium]
MLELLKAANPSEHGISKVIVWGSRATLDLLENRDWLIKENPSALEKGLMHRSLWQLCSLPGQVRKAKCDLLFIPGGSYAGDYHPVVTMSRNLLPFEWREMRHYGWSWITIKMGVLRQTQSRSFRNADGVIFLTQYAKDVVQGITGRLSNTTIIPHGINPRFGQLPRVQQPIDAYSHQTPLRILYVSIIDVYKHQWKVVEGVAKLRQKTGWPLALELVGPSYPPALSRLQSSMKRFDPEGRWVHYYGPIPFEQLHTVYGRADIGLFASSCENMPNILLETMAAGLPIACSNRGPMPEVLGDAGVYFDPEVPVEIAGVLESLVGSPKLRTDLAHTAFSAAAKFTWQRCADQTFAFLANVHQKFLVGKKIGEVSAGF